MKAPALLASALLVSALGASAQYQTDPSYAAVIARGLEGAQIHAIVVDPASQAALEAAGATVHTYATDAYGLGARWWWEGTTEGDTSAPGVDGHTGGYIARVVTGQGGWSGGGLACDVTAAFDTSAFCDNTRFHLAYRTDNAPLSLAFIILDGGDHGCLPAKISVGSLPFIESGAAYPLVGTWSDDGGDGGGSAWAGIDISLADLRRLWPAFNATATASATWDGEPLRILSGRQQGTSFAIDAAYFYTLAPDLPGAGISPDTAAPGGDGEGEPVVYYTLQGQPATRPAPGGVYIVRRGSAPAAKVRL